MLPWLPRLALFLGLLVLAAGPAAAQDAMVLPAPNPEEICTLGSSDIDTHHHVPSALHAGTDAFATASPSSTFEVTFVEGGCGSWPQEAIDAVTFATEIWSHHLSSDIPVRVEATWDASLPSGTLGSAGPRAIISDASLPAGVGRPNTWYPIAQASAMAETDFVAQFDLDTDIRMRLNCNRDNWYLGTDATPPAGTIDFVTVVLHELGHGIGFLGTMSKEDDVAEAGWGRPTNAGDVLPLAYDVFAEDTAATRLIDESVYANPSEALLDALQSGAVFAGGTEARAAYGDERPPLFAPSTWQPGSSFSHLDTDTFTGTDNALMRHQIDRASAVHAPGPVFCGMLADMAWPLGGGCTDELGASPALTMTPDILDFSVVTESSAATASLTLENTSSDITVTGDITVDGADFSGVSGTGAFSLAPGETRAIDVQFAPTAAAIRSGSVIVSHDADVPDSPLTADLIGEGKTAPTVENPIEDQTLTLDGDDITIDLASVFDNTGADPTFAATSENPDIVSTSVASTDLTLTAEATDTTTITVTVDDGTGGSATDTFTAEVVDTSPALALSPASLDFGLATEGSAAIASLTLENTSSDITVTGDITVDGADFSGVNGTGAFSLAPGEARTIEVQFAPTVAEARSGTVVVTHDAATPGSPFTATLTGEGKAAPVVAGALSDEVLQLGGGAITINLAPVFENVGAGPTYAAVSDNPGAVGTGISETELRLTAEGPGGAGITVTVDDHSGGTATTTFQAEVNQAPVVSAPVADQDVVLDGDPLTVTLDTVFTDPDGDDTPYSTASDDELIATAAVDNGVLTVAPLLPGQATISLEANDGRGGTASDAFVVTVVERQPPVVVNPVDDQTLTLGGDVFSVDLDNVFDSPEGDALTYAAAADPSTRLTLGLDGSLLTVTAMQTGPATVTTTATDEAGASVADTFEVSVDAFTVTVQRSFDDAADAANYRLVALPGAVDLDIAETLPGTTPGTSWRAFRDTGSEGSDDDSTEYYLEEYRTNSADFRFQPGRGFWLLSTVDWTFDAVLDAAQPDPDGDVHVPLHAGWNIISNPTSLDLAWADVLSHNAIDERLWRWDDGAWADLTADTLRSARAAGEAFYFFNAGGANALETLRLPTAPLEEATLQAPALTEVPTFTLTLTQAGQPVSHVRLGQATEERTYAAPPAAFGSTRLALHGERPLAGRLYEALHDRAVDLTVTATPGTDLTLTAADLPAVLGGQEAVLLEPSTGRRHDLRRTAEVPLRITTEETPLRLLLGSPAFIDDAAPPPPDLRLTRLYPNPSAGAVTIEFSLPEALPIQLEVFDVLGRQVARLHEGALGPGTHSIIWNGLLTHGSPAASGVYLVRLHAGDETRTKRLTRVP